MSASCITLLFKKRVRKSNRNAVTLFFTLILYFTSNSLIYTQSGGQNPVKTQNAANQTSSSESNTPAPKNSDSPQQSNISSEVSPSTDPQKNLDVNKSENHNKTPEATPEKTPEKTKETEAKKEITDDESNKTNAIDQTEESNEEKSIESEGTAKDKPIENLAPAKATTTDTPASTNIAKKTEPQQKENFFKALFKPYSGTGLYTGIGGGYNISFSEFLSGGSGINLFARWRQSRYFSAYFAFETGMYEMKEATLYATDSSNTDYTVPIEDANTIGYVAVAIGPVFHYPLKTLNGKLTPELGLLLFVGGLQAVDYNFGTSVGLSLAPGIRYQLFSRIFIGINAIINIWSVTELNQNEEKYNLTPLQDTTELKLQLSVSYKIL